MMLLDESSQTVVKSFYEQENENVIMIERRIYKQINKHDEHKELLHYYDSYKSGI